MYQIPTLFPEISNRETWLQIISLNDDDTGDLVTLTAANGAALYAIALEISPAPRQGGWSGAIGSYYDDSSDPVISASLADYISIIDTGTLQIKLPKSVMASLRPQTYDVYLTITDVAGNDGRQILVGKLPVIYGGRNT